VGAYLCGVKKDEGMRSVRLVLGVLAVVLLSGGQLSWGGVIRGLILDAKTGQALPGATVRIEGSYAGAAADEQGLYVLKGLEPGGYTLLVQCISYQAQRLDVQLVSYQPWKPLTLSLGLRVDKVNLAVDYRTDATGTGQETIDTIYILPALNLRLDLGEKHALRLGASRSYTLP
jgi:tonB-dependent receptor